MNKNRPNPSRKPEPLVGRICCLFAMVCLGFVPIIVALAYARGDVPEYLQHRWKFHATFVPYFFSALIAAYASVVFSVIAACFHPKPSRFILIALCVAAVIAHGQWERHLRHKARSAKACPQRPEDEAASWQSVHSLPPRIRWEEERVPANSGRQRIRKMSTACPLSRVGQAEVLVDECLSVPFTLHILNQRVQLLLVSAQFFVQT